MAEGIPTAAEPTPAPSALVGTSKRRRWAMAGGGTAVAAVALAKASSGVAAAVSTAAFASFAVRQTSSIRRKLSIMIARTFTRGP